MELSEINKRARKYGVPVVKDKTHALLAEMVQELKPKHILEIGTAVGYSGITMLEACNATLCTIEHNDDLIIQAKKNFREHGLSGRVKILHDDCLVALAKLVASNKYDGYFDFIFLDGPKAQYAQMFNLLMILLSPNGTFVADNVLFRGYVSGENSSQSKRYKTIVKRLNEFIEICKNSPKLVNFELKNIDDGIIFAKKVSDEKLQN